MNTSKAVKCKICSKKYVSKQALIDHIDRSHATNIPEGWNAARYENFLRTGKTEGRCVYCHKPTGWNDATGKYNRMCGSEKCKKIARDRANKNYIGLHGKPYSINDPEQQKKMVYGRKNSGKYVFEGEDGKKYVAMYDSSYGKDFFEMIDTFLNWDGSDIIAPSPHTYWYEYEGKKHFYIPDAYSTSLNLEIEFKDGGDNPNKHPKIQAVDKVKEQKKDEVMNSLKDQVNYIKICNKDYTGFFAMLSKLKQKDVCPLPSWDSKLESITESTSSILESDIDNVFSYYHLEKEKKENPGGWDEEQYFKTLDFAIRQELSEISLNEQRGCATRYVYTLGKEYSAVLLGIIVIKWYDYWDHVDPQYEYYWDSKEDVDKDEILSEREATMESSTKKNSVNKLTQSFLKRHIKLKNPMLNYDDLMESYRQKLFHSNLKPYEWQSLYNELINVREYLTKVVNGQSDEDKRMNYEASKALKQVEGFIQYMEEKNSTTESTDIFIEGDFSEYGKFADLDSARGPIEEESVTESSNYNDYMINGNYDYINQVLKRMVSPIKYTNMYDIFNINFGIPNNMGRANVEKQVGLVGEKIYKTYWAKNKGTKANMYAPFKFYSECNNPNEYNIIYSKYAAPFKKPCLYFYNFENNGRRYSTVIVTGNNNEPDVYLIYKNRLINVDRYKSTMLIESIVTESSNSGKVPIYIIAYRYRSPFGAMVRLKTHSDFNHVAIALSDDFEHAYTFSRRTDIDNGKMGFTEEPLSYMVKTDNTTRIKVLKVYVSKRNYSKLEGIISEYNAHKNETKFNWGGMIDIVHKNGIDNDEIDDMTMVCSSFVDYVLKESGVDLTKKPNSNLVTPEDLASSEKSNNNVSVVYQGPGRDYDPKIIQESYVSIYEGTKSVINPNYKSKGMKKLSNFKRVHITESVINKYKKEYPFLSHVRCKDTKEYICDGYIWFDEEELVAMVGSCQYTDDNTKWIVSLEITKDYKGYGLSKQVLDYATKTMNCKYLSVNKNNAVAKKIYDEYGFRVYQEDKSMYYMTIDKDIKESKNNDKLYTIDEATHIEAVKDDTKYYPVFIFLSYTGTNMAKIIKAFTHDPYAHSSLSFDTELNHMISFNKDGMVDENIFESVYKKKAANIRYSLYVYMATVDEYEAMKDFVNTLLGRRSKLRYNLLGLTNFIFGRGSEREDRFFCSEFVASVISAGNNKIFKTRPYMTSPYMLAKNKNFVFIKTGILKNYDSKVVDKIVAEKLEEGGFTNVSFE